MYSNFHLCFDSLSLVVGREHTQLRVSHHMSYPVYDSSRIKFTTTVVSYLRLMYPIYVLCRTLFTSYDVSIYDDCRILFTPQFSECFISKFLWFAMYKNSPESLSVILRPCRHYAALCVCDSVGEVVRIYSIVLSYLLCEDCLVPVFM